MVRGRRNPPEALETKDATVKESKWQLRSRNVEIAKSDPSAVPAVKSGVRGRAKPANDSKASVPVAKVHDEVGAGSSDEPKEPDRSEPKKAGPTTRSHKRPLGEHKNGSAKNGDEKDKAELDEVAPKVSRRGRKRKVVDDAEAISSDAKKVVPATSAAPDAATKKKDEPDAALVSICFTGHVPVDQHFANTDGLSVLRDDGDFDWDCMLNQSNVNRNNNKFYLMQLLTDGKSDFRVYRRWGRIGEVGRSDYDAFDSVREAKYGFAKIFKQKTGNAWVESADRVNWFYPVSGKYDLIKREFALQEPDKPDAEKKIADDEPVIPESSLSVPVQELINLICSVKVMMGQLKELKYDPSKAPLGKLSTEQIRLGYEALKRIEMCIDMKRPQSELYEACNVYYTRIPHVFSRSGIQIIDSPVMLKNELSLLASLDDAREAIRIFAQECDAVNPTDRHYQQLNCSITALDRESADYKVISESLLSTHARDNHRFDASVIDIFELNKESESTAFEDFGNRRLLWHGSRLLNFAGIIGSGLRIAPPEAPCSGYMFGKGVYFADISSKSMQYCYTSRTNPVGFMLLAEVSLGDCHKLYSCEYRLPKVLPDDKKSTHGVGRLCPKASVIFKDLPLPMGPVVEQDKSMLPDGKSTSLCFNEFIVYSTKQIRIRYLIKLHLTP